jgi:hypothetical protein
MIPALLALVALLEPRVLAPTPGAIEVDAFFEDWQGLTSFAFEHLVSGDLAGPGDLAGTVGVTYDGAHLYAGVQVKDDVLQPGAGRGGDRLALVFVVGGRKRTLEVTLNDLEGARPAAMKLDGKVVLDGRISGTTRKDGWAVELSIPLAALPGVTAGAFAFSAVVGDVDRDPTKTEAVIATAPAGGPANLRFDTTAGLFEQYLAERGALPKELGRRRTDVNGDGAPEEVVVNDTDVVVLGRGLPGGAIYFYFGHAWGEGATLQNLELKDVDGRPGNEIVVTHSRWAVPGELRVEVLEIYGVRDGFLKRMFGQKLVEERPREGAELRTTLRFLGPKKRGEPHRIAVSPAVVTGLTQATWAPAESGRSYEPIPLPWDEDKPKDVVYELRDDVWLRR